MTYFYTCQRLARYAATVCGLTRLLDKLDPGAIPPVWSDLWHLYYLVRLTRPWDVVEFGSGLSTVIIGEALRRNGHGELKTFETEPKWFASTLSLLEGKKLPVEPIPAEAIPHEYGGVKGFVHKPTSYAADMVYLDGPMLTPERRVTFDPLFMEWRRLVVDNRRETVEFLKPRLGAKVRESQLGYTTFSRS